MSDTPDGDRTALLARIAAEEERVAELEADWDAARRRLDALRKELSALPCPPSAETSSLPSNAKVALFRSLFRGRTDVFPKHWYNPKKEKQGYSPACANEWVRGVCEKPRVKCGECPNQVFHEVTDRVILDHLWGRHTAGVYPLLVDETCWFLAMDFDRGEWREDVAALRETCRGLGLPMVVERSRSGEGGHVWFFFSAPISASVARRMGCYLITETMARRPELPMSSYDRLFPNQDTMPRGGFGNLIALPFQHGPRQQGNTVFVREDGTPYADQWEVLATYTRLEPSRVTELARVAAGNGQAIGGGVPVAEKEDWGELNMQSSRRKPKISMDGQPPRLVRVVLGEQLLVERHGVPSELIHRIKLLATFQNPEFYQKQAMRLSVALTPRVISCAEDQSGHIGLPRGCQPQLEELLGEHGVELVVEDQRIDGEPLEAGFHGTLTDVQEASARALLSHDIGVLVAPPGSGKTVVGTDLVAERGRSTLILVHRTQLLDQWRTQLSVFLGMKKSAIGQIGGGRRRATGSLDVAMMQSLVRGGEVDDTVTRYGHVIVDECHHVPAVSFEKLLGRVRARYITGLTATPQRRDGLHPILQFQLGPTRFSVDPRWEGDGHPVRHRLILRHTSFRLRDDATASGIQEIYGQLLTAPARNEMILDDVIGALEEGRSPLLLSERREHVAYLEERLRNFARNLVVLRGGMGAKQRREVVDQLARIPEDEERLVLATGRFVGEGFDDARLDTLFLTLPVSWKGTLVQYAGRLHRKHQSKAEVRIYDYVDREVPMLARMLEKRLKGYRAMGYQLDPSAEPVSVPGDSHVIEYDEGALEALDTDPL